MKPAILTEPGTGQRPAPLAESPKNETGPNLHHPDPLTGEPGSHPLGAGLGATGGAMAGAVAGAVAGPAGAAIGAIVGGVAGGLMGSEVAESLDESDTIWAVAPPAWEAWWREKFNSEAPAVPGMTYDDFLPAYRLGYETHAWQTGTVFEDIEHILENRWAETRGDSRLSWSQARTAILASWKLLDEKGASSFEKTL